MERDEIGIVLGRAYELRLKIRKCMENATRRTNIGDEEEEAEENLSSSLDVNFETESLLNILDALESLEEQLTSFQNLQQQQLYEREATLAQIDHSRKTLLDKLKEYKGDDLEVIREASSFASETVEHNEDLLLPPYPSGLPHPLILDNGYPPNFPSARTNAHSGVTSPNTIQQTKKTSELEKKESRSSVRKSLTGLKLMFSVAVKTVVTLIGVASVLSIAGFEPSLRRRRNTVCKDFQLSQNQPAEEEKKNATIQCPPGKVMVIENGEPRCIVKERVEIPFEPVVVTAPNVNYGCG